MNKNAIIKKISEIYANGDNIMEYLRGGDFGKENKNSVEDIMISYDFQAGSYTKSYYNNPYKYLDNTKEQAEIIDSLDGNKASIFEPGVGEGQSIYSLVKQLSSHHLIWGGS